METKAQTILNAAGDLTLATLILKTFKDIEQNYFLRSWKASSLDAGHFVEAVRRFLDLKLSGSYLSIGNTLPPLNDRELKRLETLVGQDSYRLHIPRALVFIYGLRNKRGVGHLSTFAPNFLDGTVILATCKWILAEILRLESTLTFDETAKIVDEIIERPLAGVWEIGTVRRILHTDLSVREQVLFLLLCESPQPDVSLQSNIEYENQAYFRRVLKGLHKDRLIEYGEDGSCTLSPNGRTQAEKIALSFANG
jgi:hypothetical protein